MAVKTSILVFYLTLTRNQKVFLWANYVTLAVVNIAGFVLTMINVFQCRPVSAAFHLTISAHAKCIDIVTLYLSSSPVNIITDLAILFLPIPILTQMRLPYKQKLILVITFSFGFFVAVVDVIRIAFLQRAATNRSLAVKSIHLQSVGGADFSCTINPFGISDVNRANFMTFRRVRIALVYVVSCRSRHLDNLRLRPKPQTSRRSYYA
jgi:hypothetical protein